MQAIRMAVNSELENLRTFLSCCLEVVDNLGVISIINSFKNRQTYVFGMGKKRIKKKYKKPVCATEEEIKTRHPKRKITHILKN